MCSSVILFTTIPTWTEPRALRWKVMGWPPEPWNGFSSCNLLLKSKKKVKQSRYTPWRRLGERRYIALTHSRPQHWMVWVVSVTPRPSFTPGERTPSTHCTGGWVGLSAGLDTEARGKLLCLCLGSNLFRPVVQSVARHYTDWATSAPIMYSYIHTLFMVLCFYQHGYKGVGLWTTI
jgi:hypothetical protein